MSSRTSFGKRASWQKNKSSSGVKISNVPWLQRTVNSGFTMYVALSPAMDAWRGNESTSSIGALPAVQIKTDVLASWVLVVDSTIEGSPL